MERDKGNQIQKGLIMGKIVKKVIGILIILTMSLSMITAVFADSSCEIELSNIEYLLKKGSRMVNLSALSNKMELEVKLKNTSSTAQTVKVRVDGYKDGKIVAAETKTSGAVSIPAGAVSDTITVKMGNVKTSCDTLKVFAVCGGKEKNIAVFPYISLGIKLNGKELTEYSDDKDEYNVVLDTPYPYFEVEKRGSKQDNLNGGFDYKLPYTRVITVSQTGKDAEHKLSDRTITINMDTTSPAIPHIYNENMIFMVTSGNKTDQQKYDMKATVWKDMSGYKNDIDKVYDSWAGKGLKIVSKWDKGRLTELPQGVANVVNNRNFTIKFVPEVINAVAGANLCLFGSDNSNFRIFVKKDSGKVYFKFANAKYTPEMVSVNIAEAQGRENAITVDSTGNVKWYIDGVQKSAMIYDLSVGTNIGKITLSDVKEGNKGYTVISELKFFNKALSQAELNASDLINPDNTMATWYSNVETGISICGNIKNGASLGADEVKYFCLSNDAFVEANKTKIAATVNSGIVKSELSQDFTSYNKVAKLTEAAIISAKGTTNGENIATDELVSYIKNTFSDDISGLLDVIDESAVAGIKNAVNSANLGTSAQFDSFIMEQLIIESIVNPINYEPDNVASRIIKYQNDLGLNIGGFEKLTPSRQAEIALAVVAAKPTTKAGLESVIKSQMSAAPTAPTAGGANAGGGGGGGGGLPTVPASGDPEKNESHTVVIAGFHDMAGSEWAGEALTYMVEKGYVSGVGDGNFAPKNNITRSEFVAIIARCEAFDETDLGESIFDDVPTDFWGYKNIMAAYQNGIISGVGERTFNPNGNITRQDIAVILYNVYKRYHVQEEEDAEFSDWNSISDYAKEAVGKLHALKILNGYGSEFAPSGLCTRAEAVQAIYSYLKAVNR